MDAVLLQVWVCLSGCPPLGSMMEASAGMLWKWVFWEARRPSETENLRSSMGGVGPHDKKT